LDLHQDVWLFIYPLIRGCDIRRPGLTTSSIITHSCSLAGAADITTYFPFNWRPL